MITKAELDFLSELKLNNNREWFTDNKKRFEKHNNKAKLFFNEIAGLLGKQDSIDQVQIFRIYRDVRFSKDKAPYKHHFSVHFSRTKPMLRGGYYLHIQPGESFVGGGFWDPNPEDLLRIRKEFEMDDEEIRSITADSTFKKYFGALKGDELKTAPKGFDKTHPAIDLIRKKQYLVTRPFSDKEVLSPNFKQEVLDTFQAMRPFFDYMSEVLGTNLNGESLY
ncbi:hypothetical protein FEDK69T_04510 [Flavobacterium enshiense DK69]|uniref:TIGR02453 family protein n=1 Tax=Flavobacterium enshiense DK69 TaxID=1107311 RepID=V6SF57_9FLAO|nr:DUF2461 domain-containing protein [Flavobacterium enshiense]ESU24897.1 hypothetical protein FEDK69T_04510 [Flavobacterium enshiense DK69]KGO96659.1 hypothetical protein Q767_02810 [Flavobacterium enshiense DK69]